MKERRRAKDKARPERVFKSRKKFNRYKDGGFEEEEREDNRRWRKSG